MGGAGCAVLHTALIYDRGGADKIAQLRRVATVSWGRKLSGATTATVTISGRNCQDQAEVIDSIAPHRHELVVFRGDTRVWEGPVVRVEWLSDRAVVTAKDVTAYLDGAVLSKDWPGPDEGGPSLMTDRIGEILEHELTVPYDMRRRTGAAAETITVPRWEGVAPPANVWPFVDVRPSATLKTRSATEAFEMTVGEHLGDLAESYLDYTAVGRSLIVWDSADSIGQLRVLTDADFYGEITVSTSGTGQASIAHVSAQAAEEDDSETAVGNAGGPDPFYGVWETIHSSQSEEGEDSPTQDALNSQAQRVLLGRRIAPTSMEVPSSAGIRLSHDLRINDLVAGVRVPVRAVMNLKPVSQMQRLDELTVTEDESGESVQVSLKPWGDLEAIIGG